jgi:hypothetical protein
LCRYTATFSVAGRTDTPTGVRFNTLNLARVFPRRRVAQDRYGEAPEQHRQLTSVGFEIDAVFGSCDGLRIPAEKNSSDAWWFHFITFVETATLEHCDGLMLSARVNPISVWCF